MNDELRGELIAAMTEQILSALQRQDFADWYGENGRFDAFIRGGKEMENVFGTSNYRVAEVLIMKDIQRLFKLV
jgi:hypothetical protein